MFLLSSPGSFTLTPKLMIMSLIPHLLEIYAVDDQVNALLEDWIFQLVLFPPSKVWATMPILFFFKFKVSPVLVPMF